MKRLFLSLIFNLLPIASAFAAPNRDLVFVTLPPFRTTNLFSVTTCFGNSVTSVGEVPRGGDLYIRYGSDGTLKNITAAAGFGKIGDKGDPIAVRDPVVHWDGKKVLFTMLIDKNGLSNNSRWQLYEVTGLGRGETPKITKVLGQPEAYNNTMPVYTSDDRIIFVSDRPRECKLHLYPLLDEYRSDKTNTGLWMLDSNTGDLSNIEHSPSGSFTPFIDSFGRLLFSRWDHLQVEPGGGGIFTNLVPVQFRSEEKADVLNRSPVTTLFASLGHFSIMNPWEMNQDGSEMETLNHLGRHEFNYGGLTATSLRFTVESHGDPTVSAEIPAFAQIANKNSVRETVSNLVEDITEPGRYYAVSAHHGYTQCAGMLVSFLAPRGKLAGDIEVKQVTHPSSETLITENVDSYPIDPQVGYDPGFFRDPLKLSDGSMIAVNISDRRLAIYALHQLRLVTLASDGKGYLKASEKITPGITKQLDGATITLGELQPRELVARNRPPLTAEAPVSAPEQEAFNATGVSIAEFREYLRRQNLAAIVVRNATSRDSADRQQPFNLKVAKAGGVASIGTAGPVNLVSDLEIFQADAIRSHLSGTAIYQNGRRHIPVKLHEDLDQNPVASSSFPLEVDGSVAAIVPARRALTWQLTGPTGEPVVKERYWLTFQPGEVRTCGSCHGVSRHDQAGRPAPTNSPLAMRTLLNYYRDVLKPQVKAAKPSIACDDPRTKNNSETPAPAPTPTPIASDKNVKSALNNLNNLFKNSKYKKFSSSQFIKIAKTTSNLLKKSPLASSSASSSKSAKLKKALKYSNKAASKSITKTERINLLKTIFSLLKQISR